MNDTIPRAPRMFAWVLATLALVALALFVQDGWPGSMLAVTLYKGHLMALGGWGGYWLDRALFPYDRPHTYLEDDDLADAEALQDHGAAVGLVSTSEYGYAMLRRAIVVGACLVCVGLGA